MKLTITVSKVKIHDAKQQSGNENVIPVFPYNYRCNYRFYQIDLLKKHHPQGGSSHQERNYDVILIMTKRGSISKKGINYNEMLPILMK